ncbi:hypothetical protein D3C76_1556110 [compost metagenome]
MLSGYRPKPAEWPSIMFLADSMRWLGMNTSLRISVLVPLPRMPQTNQSSLI